MEDGTPIDRIIGDAAVQLGHTPVEAPVETRMAHQSAQKPGGDWVRFVAKRLVDTFSIFGLVLLVSMPQFQDLVLSWLPKAVNSAGTLSVTGAFFKALIASVGFNVIGSLMG